MVEREGRVFGGVMGGEVERGNGFFVFILFFFFWFFAFWLILCR